MPSLSCECTLDCRPEQRLVQKEPDEPGHNTVSAVDAEERWFDADELIPTQRRDECGVTDYRRNHCGEALLVVPVGSGKYAIVDGNTRYYKWWNMGGKRRIMRGKILLKSNVASLSSGKYLMTKKLTELKAGKTSYDKMTEELAELLKHRGDL